MRRLKEAQVSNPPLAKSNENLFRIAYVRGPEGLILELTEDLKATSSGE
jgi:hypothetical protein